MRNKSGRKFWLSVVSLLIILAGFSITPISSTLMAVYKELITGVLGVLIVYCGGNVSNKYVLKKKEENNNGTD